MFDFILLFIAGVCQLFLGFLGIILSTRRTTKAQKTHYEWVFLIIGVIGFAAIVWSGWRSVSVQETIADGVEQIEIKLGINKAGNGQPEETRLYFQCEASLMPRTFPSSGEIWVYQPLGANALEALTTFGGATLGKVFGQPQGEVKWLNDPAKIATGQKCQLFNYGNGPLFDVMITFDVVLREVVKHTDGGGSNSGAILQSGKWNLDVPKIDEGRSNPFEFYFFNRMWPYFIQIGSSPTATSIKSNDAARQSVKLISSAHNQPIWINPGSIEQ